MKNQELRSLREWLICKVGDWNVCRIDPDELVDVSISRYWEASNGGCEIHEPKHWLLRTAQNVKRELHRQSTANQSVDDHPDSNRSAKTSHCSGEIDLGLSRMWNSLPEQQRYVVQETVMFDRSVAKVAKELGIKRSTAKSWKQRIPLRLAKDEYLRSLATHEVEP